MNDQDRLRVFHLAHSMLRADLDGVEKLYGVDLGFGSVSDSGRDQVYYPQFSQSVRAEAAAMAEHYEIFYCLENSIREIVREKLEAKFAQTWWDTAVPDAVKENVKRNLQREREAGVTLRSTDLIDYTTFGELGEIIQHNWEVFGDTFNNQKALGKVLTGLNLLRGPIAHCAPLAPDEVVRLRLALADWFRLME